MKLLLSFSLSFPFWEQHFINKKTTHEIFSLWVNSLSRNSVENNIQLFYQELLLYYKLSQESYQVYIIHQILIQHLLVFSFLLEKSIMDGLYIIFILVEHHLSFFSFYYILEELYLMVHTFIIVILGFLEFFFSSS